jgi:hypothetical protein
MLTSINPKLPMRNKSVTKDFYTNLLGFRQFGSDAYPDYLMVEMDAVQIHFFLYNGLDPEKNDGQVYIRTNSIEELYQIFLNNGVPIHPNGHLETKAWGQKEFSILDPNKNLLTFGQEI